MMCCDGVKHRPDEELGDEGRQEFVEAEFSIRVAAASAGQVSTPIHLCGECMTSIDAVIPKRILHRDPHGKPK